MESTRNFIDELRFSWIILPFLFFFIFIQLWGSLPGIIIVMTNQFITRKEVADLYGISPKTLVRRLEKRGIKLDKGLITPADLEKIKRVLGDLDKQVEK